MADRSAPRDARKVHVASPPAGAAAPPASGHAGGSTEAPSASRRAPASPPPPSAAAPTGRRGRRRRGLRRPRLRRVLLVLSLALPILLLLAAVGGWFYARSVYDRIDKIPLAAVLSSGGGGTNYLIAGSDTRDPATLQDAGLNPDAFLEGGGQRSDTLLLLRFSGGDAQLMSIPRDLYVPIAETGSRQKINAAYNGGPSRLVQTVQQALGVPVHHYLEVDFVSFAALVDALGGVTVDFPHPAFDPRSGLHIDEAGPQELDGPQALAYVRSRNYTEVVDGRNVVDPTADLGRILRQQQFLRAVFSELGSTRNPLTLARAASDAAGGLRVDDELSLWDAIQFAWRLRSLDPEPVALPVDNARNEAGSVVVLREPDADAALGRFR